ncbi:kinetochore protein Mis18 [Schizosaccharomyces japonicus yFS275]|uniref:Kinetochore protein Mis18 n=1 Tax=Schizosaccharomyces japonicus (strain yFS275 / FY16936) TaxID=402676 RepID=B6K0J9_SCHJY|nr:kinetochore protein Mis18 [Schizosaccharomyces japonicus yFS275]EEB07470.2 kinetochore protein Mis18 [Schizosaccharomyces japonicus yFS275]
MKTSKLEEEENIQEQKLVEPVPVVFQCLNCLQIVGDSNSWVISKEELNTVTLRDVPVDRVRVSKRLETTKDGLCVYSKIYCLKCNFELGMVFRATSKALDELRDMYTFRIDKIESYELGQKSFDTLGNTRFDIDIQMKEDILKLKSFCLSLSERWQLHDESLQAIWTILNNDKEKNPITENNVRHRTKKVKTQNT